jgi:aspartyl-tRNA synthetase
MFAQKLTPRNTTALAKTQVGIFQKVLSSGGKIKAVNIKALGGHMNDKEIEQIQAEAKSQGKGVVTVKVHNGQWKTSIAKHLTPTEIEQLNKDLDAHDGDLLLIAAGEGDDPLQLLGKLRLYCSNILQQKGLLVIPPNRFDFFWVVDFPLFTWEDGSLGLFLSTQAEPN